MRCGLALLGALLVASAAGQTLPLPPRGEGALSGTAVVAALTGLSLEAREARIWQEVMSGNVPEFLRTLAPVTVTAGGRTAVCHVTPDYLALGSDADYFLCPMSPGLAQRIADRLGCNLPTRKMVNDIWAAAQVHLTPQPIPPSPEMTTVPVFAQHSAMVWGLRSAVLADHPLGTLVGGDKKDVVVTPQLATRPGHVAIYGWHQLNGTPIQPLYLGHTDTWVDYSHGIRLVQSAMTVDGQPTTVDAVLGDAALAGLLSDEGAFTNTRYPAPEGLVYAGPLLP